jgi:hypothetical protein
LDVAVVKRKRRSRILVEVFDITCRAADEGGQITVCGANENDIVEVRRGFERLLPGTPVLPSIRGDIWDVHYGRDSENDRESDKVPEVEPHTYAELRQRTG